jgi:hypothetical protein
MNSKKHTVMYSIGLSSIALALVFMISPNNNRAIAQQSNTIAANPYSGFSSQNQNWTGSISLFSPIIDTFKSKIHTTLNDATTNAIKAIGGTNSSAVAAFIHPERGFIVYDVLVLDSNNNIHRVIVDPGNGKVLSTQLMSMMDMMSMVHPSMGMMMGGPRGMGMMGPPQDMMMDRGMMDHGMGMMGSQDGVWH